ncbi:condensin-2 complex subunit H2-like isoform X2 [Lycium barbarum]|nr:condensin-2 complex subunit H2 [Lycium ferocissimum]XP_059312655.1 condensin-2 complex subunit H2 [Lycium ferocissimum]XP_059312656.1 condensin-2 complex subunit H2 [Lycium ferocissimum]XP_060218620.1 condensin-2 complex subunit H2-like isoform X2 [Lycium barbarum]
MMVCVVQRKRMKKNDYDSADHDFGPPDFDMPENADMNSNATPHGEKESHLPFDIYEYGVRVLSKLSLEGNDESAMSFPDVVMGSEKHDIARTFSALLQLICR